jgi:Zn-dependent M28 family amino/carboxypeptidase
MYFKAKTIFWGVLIVVVCFSSSCKEDKPETTTPPKKEVKVPKFDRDSSYVFVEKQVSFGPRVTNTAEHTACKDWLISKFKSYGAEVIEQDFKATAYTGTVLNATNIIAQYNPDNKTRILLAAHWDSRPMADHDPNEANHDKPILGADDGASGVGILLEIARQLKLNPIDLGVDIILFDAEDYGESKGEDYKTWCLGSQYWGKNLHKSGYRTNFGILLDMVGAENARFTMDETSMTFAPAFMRKVWKLAQAMGYGSYFVSEQTQILIDDHLFINQLTGIPTIDIINRPMKSETGFGDYWHTLHDDMTVIDKRTLRAVGQTVLAVVYRENNGTF